MTLADLRTQWVSRLNPSEIQTLDKLIPKQTPDISLKASPSLSVSSRDLKTAQDSLEYALSHLFEQNSTVPEQALKNVALRHNPEVRLPALESAMTRHRELLRGNYEGEVIVTTKTIRREEAKLISLVKAGHDRYKPLAQNSVIQNNTLGEDQINAVRHVWQNTDWVTAIEGAAGSGKTTLMKEAVRGLEENGRKVLVLAPTANAARIVLRGEGFENADTVAGFFTRKELQESIRGGVVWVDEAGLLGTKDLKLLTTLARENNTRLIFSGDTRQHRSVARGDALRTLIDHAGLKAAQVNQIHRQKGIYRDAMQALRAGEIQDTFSHLSAMNVFTESFDEKERIQATVRAYISARERSETARIFSPTHREKNSVIPALRDALKEKHYLKADTERPALQFKHVNLSEAEKTLPESYQLGQVLRFHRRTTLGKAGTRFTIDKINGDFAYDRHGRSVNLRKKADAFNVFTKDQIKLAVGDKIRIKAGESISYRGRGFKTLNGQQSAIQKFLPDGSIALSNGHILPRNFGYLEYAYTSTSHGSQGITVDRAILLQSGQSARASSLEQFYVSTSRGRNGLEIITDSKDRLQNMVQNARERLSATELAQYGELTQAPSPVEEIAARIGLTVKNKVAETTEQLKQSTEKLTQTVQDVVENVKQVVKQSPRVRLKL